MATILTILSSLRKLNFQVMISEKLTLVWCFGMLFRSKICNSKSKTQPNENTVVYCRNKANPNCKHLCKLFLRFKFNIGFILFPFLTSNHTQLLYKFMCKVTFECVIYDFRNSNCITLVNGFNGFARFSERVFFSFIFFLFRQHLFHIENFFFSLLWNMQWNKTQYNIW